MRRGSPARSSVVAGLCAVLVLAGGCSTTNPDVREYHQQAYLALGAAVSEVATTRLFLGQLEQGDVFRTTATTQIRYSDQAIGSEAQAFGSNNPPVSAWALYQRCTSLLSEAQDLVAEVRIAVHRDDTSRYARLVQELAVLGKQLERLQSQVSS